MTEFADAQTWIERAVELAVANVADDGGPFGAVVVRDGAIVGSGTNRVTADLDPTAHAEVLAMRRACRALDTFSLAGCVLVSSCEPCPMCLATSLWARVDAVLYAADRLDAAQAGFDDLEFHRLMQASAQWPVPLRQVPAPHRTSPFEAWLARRDRVEY